MGGRLGLFTQEWSRFTGDSWVLGNFRIAPVPSDPSRFFAAGCGRRPLDAYLHIPLHPGLRRFVTFAFEGTQYMFRALPFGLFTAPRVFTRITRVMAAFIRRRGIRIFMYLDDWLIVADDPVAAETHTRWVMGLALRLGWLINPQKSELVPSQKPIS